MNDLPHVRVVLQVSADNNQVGQSTCDRAWSYHINILIPDEARDFELAKSITPRSINYGCASAPAYSDQFRHRRYHRWNLHPCVYDLGADLGDGSGN
jgi:hypothetical protein